MLKIVDEAERASIYLYGAIGTDFFGEGNSAEDFARQLDALGGKPLDIHIDSGGGDVYEGFAMCAAIQNYKGETTAYVEGMAASAASYIAVVCDQVVLNDYSWIMIHNAASFAYGNAKSLLDLAARLEGIDNALVDIYVARTGRTAEDITADMERETWYSAQDALDKGFATQVKKTEERMVARLDAALAPHYRHVPQAVAVVENPVESDSPPIMGISEPQEPPASEAQEREAKHHIFNGRIFKGENK